MVGKDGQRTAVGGLGRAGQSRHQLPTSWGELQRRVARRSAGVAVHSGHTPKLMATVEDVDQADWYEDVERWPEVAKQAAILPEMRFPEEEELIGTGIVPDCILDLMPLVEPLASPRQLMPPHSARGGARQRLQPEKPLPLQHRTTVTFALDEDDSRRSSSRRAASGLLGVKTPPYARRCNSLDLAQLESDKADAIVPPTHSRDVRQSVHGGLGMDLQRLLSMGAAAAGSRSVHRSSTFLDMPPERSAPLVTKLPTKTVAARKAQERWAERQHQVAEVGEPRQEQVLEKLEYLDMCRQLLGDDRFGTERRRFELQAQIKASCKYSLADGHGNVIGSPPPSRGRPGGEVPGKPQQPLPRWGSERSGSSDESSDDVSFGGAAAAAASASATRHSRQKSGATLAKHGLELPHAVSAMVDAAVGRGSTGTSGLPAAAGTEWLDQSIEAKAAAVLQYERMCESSKVTMPGLGALAYLALCSYQDATMPLHLDRWALGDEPFVALAATPLGQAFQYVEHAGLRGNRLTHSGLAAVTKCFGSLSSLDLAENCFDRRGADVLISFLRKGAPHLVELDVSHNKMGDVAVAELCRALYSGCSFLQRLGLADVQMGAGMQSGSVLNNLLIGSRFLTSLDVSYNSLQGEGARELLDAVLVAGTEAGELKNLDLAFNSLGKGSMKGAVVRVLASVLKTCSGLAHLDISYNGLDPQDCRALAKALVTNRTLFGLHVDGNAAVLDCDGYLHVLADAQPEGASPDAKQAAKKLKKATAKDKTSKAGPKEEQMRAVAQAVLDASRLEDIQWHLLMHSSSQQKSHELQTKETIARLTNTVQLKGKQAAAVFTKARQPPGRPVSPRTAQEELRGIVARVPLALQKPRLGILLDAATGSLTQFTGGGRRSNRRTSGIGPPPVVQSQGCMLMHGASEQHPKGSRASCWLCGGWVEVCFTVNFAAVEPESTRAPEDEVFAFLSIDNFARPVLLECLEGGSVWQGSRWLPPSQDPFLLVFMTGGRLFTSKQLPTKMLVNKMQLPIRSTSSAEARMTRARRRALAERAAARRRDKAETMPEDDGIEQIHLEVCADEDDKEVDDPVATTMFVNLLFASQVAHDRHEREAEAERERALAEPAQAFEPGPPKRGSATRTAVFSVKNKRQSLPQEWILARALPRPPLPPSFWHVKHLPPEDDRTASAKAAAG